VSAKGFFSTPVNFICSCVGASVVCLSLVYAVTQSETTTVKIADTAGNAVGVGLGATVGGIPDLANGVTRTIGRSEIVTKDGSDAAKQVDPPTAKLTAKEKAAALKQAAEDKAANR
jgi:hypothetical protein